ncbi:MAG: hypothetical protein IPL79_02135 [Myxococcales bacterium]|nr:hypothetical protein [Myxococcales bacterium]
MQPVDLSACRAAPQGEPFALSEEVATQVNLDLAFHDGVLWVAYDGAAVDGSSDSDVYVARLGCAQTLLGPPVVASTAANTLDGDLSIAVNGSSAVVAWLADDKVSSNNLSIRTRAYHPDGTAIGASELRLDLQAEGEVTSAWVPRVTSAGLGFWLAGTQVVPSANTFQLFVHRLDEAGQLSGVRSHAAPEAGVFHHNPDIRVDDASIMQVLFERDVDGALKLAQGAFVGEHLAITDFEAGANAASPRWARGDRAAPMVQVWGASTSPGPVGLRLETEGGALLASVGDPGLRNVLPAAAMHGHAGLVSWHEAISPTTSRVMAAPFSVQGGAIVVGAPQEVAPLALSYGPAVAHVVDNIYVVGWTLTSAGDRRAMGTFFVATPP